MKKPQLALILPCYNKGDLLDIILNIIEYLTFLIKNDTIKNNSYLLLIDDGSNDNTWYIIENFAKVNPLIRGIKLSKNFGQKNALISGFKEVTNKCDIGICLDANTNKLNYLNDFINKYNEGYDIVLGAKENVLVNNIFEKYLYNIFTNLLDIKTLYHYSDCKLISNKVLTKNYNIKDINIFLNNIENNNNFNTCKIQYNYKNVKKKRTHNLHIFLLLMQGLKEYKSYLFKVFTISGLILFIINLFYSLSVITLNILKINFSKWIYIFILFFLSLSIVLCTIGFIGEYFIKTYILMINNTKYIIEKKIKFNKNKKFKDN